MCDAPQTGFDAAQHNRHVAVRFFTALGIGHRRTVWPFTFCVVWRVSIVMAEVSVRRVAVDHRIHIAGGDTKEQVWLAEFHEDFIACPVGLGDYPDAIALRLQHPPYDRHTETRMINISIASHHDHITAVPAKLIHLLA